MTNTIRFSANLGFLYRDRSLPDAIRAAGHAGFSAVEAHWPYEHDAREIRAILAETGLPLLSVNTARGNADAGEFGLCGVPGRVAEAHTSIDQAVNWAENAGALNIHVMAGKASGVQAMPTFRQNLQYAAKRASSAGIGILIEPLNPRDNPGYLLADMSTAAEIAADTGARIMFDCYHLQIIQGDLLNTFRRYNQLIGHVQIASVPDRSLPDHGEVDYEWLVPALAAEGYDGYFGVEYTSGESPDLWMGRWTDKKL